jgi:uncharacterized membrane protein
MKTKTKTAKTAKRKMAKATIQSAAARRLTTAAVPTTALLVTLTPQVLAQLTRGNFGGVTAPAAPARATANDTAPRRVASAKTNGNSKKGGGAANLRGRVAGNYVPSTSKKLPEGVNPKVAKVYNFIARHKKGGITQKTLVETSKLPNSTVWYALVKLREMKLVKYLPAA